MVCKMVIIFYQSTIRETNVMNFKSALTASAVAVFLGTTASAATIGITEGTRGLVAGTTAVAATDTSQNPALAFDLDTLGTLGADSFEVYGRIVDSLDNFAFGFSSTASFRVSWIFGGYDLAAGGSVANSGFVSEGNAIKSATFNLLDADNGFSVVKTLTATTDITSGPELIFSAGAGNYVLQVDGTGANAQGSGVGLYDVQISAVPLPAGFLLLGTALGGLGIARRRKTKKAAA